uniref:Reverse transcriptase zinc-binding domain-containing protein n=1 Tax=Oryza rufipogon TaxID=4529 RepID=A0A0E0QJ59_ORYRU
MDESRKTWKVQWKINAPGKMKINLWRDLYDCLQTGFQLHKRQILATDRCVFYNRGSLIEQRFHEGKFVPPKYSVSSHPLTHLGGEERFKERQVLFLSASSGIEDSGICQHDCAALLQDDDCLGNFPHKCLSRCNFRSVSEMSSVVCTDATYLINEVP